MLLAFVPDATAETIRLKNGNELIGTIEQSDERTVTVRVPEVGTLTLSRSEIVSIGAGNGEAEPTTAPAPSSPPSEAPELALFKSPSRSVRLWYPKGWHVLESKDQYPYLVTVEPTPPNPDLTAMTPTTIELFKFYHVSLTMAFGRGTPREVLEQYIKTLPSLGGGGTILAQRTLTVQGAPAQLIEMQAKDPRGTIPLQMFILASVKDDVLASLYCQAPAAEFETHRRLYEAVARRVEPFSTNPNQPDNAALDGESAQLGLEALTLLKAGKPEGVVERFERAIRMNPADASTRMNYGSVLMTVAKNQTGQTREAMLARAEQEFRLAATLFEMAGPLQQVAPFIAQAYFLLGEIAHYGRDNRTQAKALYEQALRYYRHPGAEQALKRLSSP